MNIGGIFSPCAIKMTITAITVLMMVKLIETGRKEVVHSEASQILM